MSKEYEEFLKQKAVTHPCTGIAKPKGIHKKPFPFQRDIINWGLRRGRAAIFTGTGTGKTLMQSEYGRHVAKHTGKPVLIFAPLAVGAQTIAEAKRLLDLDITWANSGADITEPKVYITNYGKMHKFDYSVLGGVILDESSILKSETGSTRNFFIDACQNVPFRLACTASPAPNDFMEIGNHAEFLGVMTMSEMLAMFFVHDGGETQKWRLKGHAEADFFKWMASWCVYITSPADIGYSSGGYDLPPLRMHEVIVKSEIPQMDGLFVKEATTLTERRTARRETIDNRSKKVLELIYGQFPISSMVLRQQTPPRQGGEKEIHGGVSDCESWEIQKEPKAAREGKRGEEEEIQGELGIQGVREKEVEGILGEQPGEKASAETEEIQFDDPSIRGADGISGEGLRDLRSLGSYSEGIPIHRPLPQDRQGEGDSVQRVQLRDRKAKRQSKCLTGGLPLPSEKWVVWCGLNAEQDGLAEMLGDHCVSISGSDTDESKIAKEHQWRLTDTPILLTKGVIFGYGLNWQHCHKTIFFGISDSFEQFFQIIRRFWRFGQKEAVDCWIVISDQEGKVLQNIKRKEKDADTMQKALVGHMADLTRAEISGEKETIHEYLTDMKSGEGWTAYLGDCVEMIRKIASNTIGYVIYSPPFEGLYVYSASDRDMGNSKDSQEFMTHYKFLLKELFRVTMPGRLLSFHCMNLPNSKARDGFIGIRDFRGELIRAAQDAGFIYHSEVCIFKDPVTAMQRTKAIGLLHKTIRKDSSMSRQGIPDYLVTMRKPGENTVPVNHYRDEEEMLTKIGSRRSTAEEREAGAAAGIEVGEFIGPIPTDEDRAKIFPVQLWQQYASPVWMDINPSNTLQHRSVREHQDERHICPLQLEVIERALLLWTNKDDLVLSPFMGIGSEGYVARKLGRRFVGTELKGSYFRQACANLAAASTNRQLDLFEGMFDEPAEINEFAEALD